MLRDVTELIVVDDMHQRKKLMFDKSDAFVALPGGIGTLEELVEQLTWAQLGRHTKPIVLVRHRRLLGTAAGPPAPHERGGLHPPRHRTLRFATVDRSRRGGGPLPSSPPPRPATRPPPRRYWL